MAPRHGCVLQGVQGVHIREAVGGERCGVS